MIVEVQCYAGRKADERPVRFRIGDRDHIIEEIVEQWYGPDDSFYRVRADDGKRHLLRRNDDVAVAPYIRPNLRKRASSDREAACASA
jgi:hypothetical protein